MTGLLAQATSTDMHILAQAVPNDIAGWLTGSAVTALAFIVFAFIKGLIVPGQTHARTLAKCDEQAAELRDLYGVFMETVVPTLRDAQSALAEVARDRSR